MQYQTADGANVNYIHRIICDHNLDPAAMLRLTRTLIACVRG